MNFNKTRQKTKPGFSFIELMIAMVILFLAVMVVGSIFPVSFKSLLKSKQVTVATTLAQQKLEQCLVNPRDYKTRVGEEGDFKPEHPEYRYSITKKSATNKLDELKVEVYKLINERRIVDAAVAQLIQSGGQKIYEIKGDIFTCSGSPGAVYTVFEHKLKFSEDGVCLVQLSAIVYSPATQTLVRIYFFMDDSRYFPEGAITVPAATEESVSTLCYVNVSKDIEHTFSFKVSHGIVSSNIKLLAPYMRIHFIPSSQAEILPTIIKPIY